MPPVTVAAAQFFSGADVADNVALCVRYLEEAAAAGAALVVLPENSNRVRDFTTREDAFAAAETVDGGFITGLADAARRLGIYVAVGVDVRGARSPDVYICSVLITAEGEVAGVVRKNVLWDYEYGLFVPGDEPYRVFETPFARLGLHLCADGIVPETPRALALGGAQVLCNSLNSRGPDELRVHVPLRAMENRVWHIAANTVGGPANAWPWMGGSQIISPAGEQYAVASELEAQLIVATIDPDVADDKTVPGIGSVVGRRRPDLYGLLTLPGDEVPAASMYGPAPADQPARPVDVALLQVSHFPSAEWTVHRAVSQVAYAGARGADIGVLPAYFCFDRGEVATDPKGAAERSAEALERLAAAAADAGIWVAAHLVEADGGHLYSTVHLIDRTGAVAHRYRKTHLDESEARWATPGDDLAVFETELGRIGVLVTDEIWVPEAARVLALGGAELIIHPTDWDRIEAATVAATERTEENRVHLVSVNRLDSPGTIGSQVLINEPFRPNQPIALMRYPTGQWTRYGFEEQLVVRLDLKDSHEKMMGHFLDPLAKRHPELYKIFVA